MRFLVLTLALAMSSSWAQDKPAPKQAAKPAPAAAAAVPVSDKPVVEKKSRRSEDARHCLEKTSNPEVIKCAEAYL